MIISQAFNIFPTICSTPFIKNRFCRSTFVLFFLTTMVSSIISITSITLLTFLQSISDYKSFITTFDIIVLLRASLYMRNEFFSIHISKKYPSMNHNAFYGSKFKFAFPKILFRNIYFFYL